MMKRFMSLILVAVLIFSLVPAAAGAEAESTVATQSEAGISGTNSFGNLLSDAVAQEEAPEEED